jgi:hypothetical protein
MSLEQINEPLIPQVDSKAKEEVKNWTSESRRKRREENVVHWGFVILVWAVFIGVTFVVISKISHLVLPTKYHWLDEVHLKKIDDFLTTGTIGGIVVGFFKNKMQSK